MFGLLESRRGNRIEAEFARHSVFTCSPISIPLRAGKAAQADNFTARYWICASQHWVNVALSRAALDGDVIGKGPLEQEMQKRGLY